MALYYWAGGKKRTLEVSGEHIAIDGRAAARAGVSDAAASLPVLSTLPGGITVVDHDAPGVAKLAAAKVTRPVYRSGASLVVLMPEIRVELDAGQHDPALKVITAAGAADAITDDTPERITLQLRSGSGEDALALANRIYEQAKVAASAPRMLQVVARPGTKR